MEGKTKIKRSRKGCHTCKSQKVKCDEQKPLCSYCIKTNNKCDYSIKLTWGGRPFKNASKGNSIYSTTNPPVETKRTIVYTTTNPPTKRKRKNPKDAANNFVPMTPLGLTQTINTIKQEDFADSSPAFTTPGGVSLLSPLQDFEDLDAHKIADFNGFLGLPHKLDVFNRFLFEEARGSTESTPTEPFSPGIFISDEFINDYSTDIARIDAYMPKRKPGLLNELSPYSPAVSLKGSGPPVDFFESIPPLLTPFPELLNQVPYYKKLMHFWVTVAADNLVPAPPHLYHDNPFKILLPQMAMQYPAILTAILAFAATLMALISGRPKPKEIVDQLMVRSCSMLLKMLKDQEEATSDGTLATVLLLSCYELLSTGNSERHRAHALGAREIINARKDKRVKSPDSDLSESSYSMVGKEGDIAFFLMRWFAYVDVVGALSATRDAQCFLTSNDSYDTSLEFDGGADPKRDIDYIYGFDVRFLPHLAEIVRLIRRTDVYLETARDFSTIPVDIISQALEVKTKFENTYVNGEARRQEKLDRLNDFTHSMDSTISEQKRRTKKLHSLVIQDNLLRSTNKLFYNMGLINLYRRALKIPRNSILIQELASEIGHITENNISPQSSAEVCSISCLFTAGCEILDHGMRQLFKQRFDTLALNGNVIAAKSLPVMDRCWETGEDWIEAARVLDIDLTLL